MRSRIALFLFLALAIMAAPMEQAHAADDWAVRQSTQSVEETVARLTAAIERSGSVVLATFDHRAAAREVGHELPPTVLVLFATPRASSPLIAGNRRAAIDLPQKILVWEEDGNTYVGFVEPSALVSRYGFDAARPELSTLRSAMESLVAAAVGRQDKRTGNFGVAVPNANIGIVAPGQIANVAFLNQGGNRSDYFGTVRGRLGYAFDRMMIYGTGGVAFRDTGNNNNNTFFGFNNGFQQKQEDVGYAVGGGVEYAFTPNITAKVEGLYVNFSEGRRTNNFGGQVVGVTNFGVPIVQTGTRGRDDDFAVVRAGINYKFNGF